MALAFTAMSCVGARAEEPPLTDCDTLAAHRYDTQRVALKGVSRSSIDLPEAIAACADALAQYPDTPRLHYQLGRVLFYAGQEQQGITHVELAADRNYLQALFVLGWVWRGGEGLDANICRSAGLWKRAADLGQFWAKYYLALDSLEGRLEGCWTRVDDSMRMDLLESALQIADEDETFLDGRDEVIGLRARIRALQGGEDRYSAP